MRFRGRFLSTACTLYLDPDAVLGLCLRLVSCLLVMVGGRERVAMLPGVLGREKVPGISLEGSVNSVMRVGLAYCSITSMFPYV